MKPGHLADVTSEPDTVLSESENAELLKEWAANGPQGPLDSDSYSWKTTEIAWWPEGPKDASPG